MRLQDIMSTEVESIAPGANAEVAWHRMRRSGIHHLVVMSGGELVGILSDRDLGGARGQSLRAARNVSDLMSKAPVCAAPDTTLRRAANLLRGRAIGCLPVIERSKVKGIVTVSDILDILGRGVERPVVRGKRWTLRHRGPRATRRQQPERA